MISLVALNNPMKANNGPDVSTKDFREKVKQSIITPQSH
ncbi:MAG: hypothetical protein K0S32_795 [Bacteroidetes bacterium]|jgi:hypothetical protein|nr:hypothetical protein [Bacteroidota bacterium]